MTRLTTYLSGAWVRVRPRVGLGLGLGLSFGVRVQFLVWVRVVVQFRAQVGIGFGVQFWFGSGSGSGFSFGLRSSSGFSFGSVRDRDRGSVSVRVGVRVGVQFGVRVGRHVWTVQSDYLVWVQWRPRTVRHVETSLRLTVAADFVRGVEAVGIRVAPPAQRNAAAGLALELARRTRPCGGNTASASHDLTDISQFQAPWWWGNVGALDYERSKGHWGGGGGGGSAKWTETLRLQPTLLKQTPPLAKWSQPNFLGSLTFLIGADSKFDHSRLRVSFGLSVVVDVFWFCLFFFFMGVHSSFS